MYSEDMILESDCSGQWIRFNMNNLKMIQLDRSIYDLKTKFLELIGHHQNTLQLLKNVLLDLYDKGYMRKVSAIKAWRFHNESKLKSFNPYPCFFETVIDCDY